MRPYIDVRASTARQSSRPFHSVADLIEGGKHYEEAIDQFRTRLAELRVRFSTINRSSPEPRSQTD